MAGPDDLVLCSGTLPRGIPFAERLEAAAAAGFAGISLWGRDYAAARAEGSRDEDLRAMLADHGLFVAELDPAWWWLPGAADVSIPPELDTGTCSASARRDLFAIADAARGPLAQRGRRLRRGAGAVDGAAEAFAGLCDRAAEHGLLVHLEWLPWSKIPDLATACRRRAARGPAPTAGSTSTPGTWSGPATTAEDLAHAPGELVLGVQLDDGPASAEADLVEATLHDRLLPGEGEFDLAGYRRRTAATGTAAPIGVEVFSDDAPRARSRRRRPTAAAATRRVLGTLPDDADRPREARMIRRGRRRHRLRLRHPRPRAAGRGHSRSSPLVGRDPDKTAERAALFERPAGAHLGRRGARARRRRRGDHRHPAAHPRAARARQAIAAGKHVLCEKPFARDDGRGGARCWPPPRRPAIVHLLGCEFRWDPGQAGLARAVAAGRDRRAAHGDRGSHVPLLADPSAEVPAWWADAGAGRRVAVARTAPSSSTRSGSPSASSSRSAPRCPTSRRPGHDRRRRRSWSTSGCAPARWASCSRRRGTRGVLVETRVTGSTGAAWIEGVGPDGQGGATPKGRTHAAGPRGPADRTRRRRCPKGGDHHVRADDHLRDGLRPLHAPRRRVPRPDRRADPAAEPQPATFVDGVAQMAVLDAITSSAAAGGRWTAVEPGP